MEMILLAFGNFIFYLPVSIFLKSKPGIKKHDHGNPCAKANKRVRRPFGAPLTMWGFRKITGIYPFGGPHNKDCSMLGSIFGYPDFGELPCILCLADGWCWPFIENTKTHAYACCAVGAHTVRN